MNKVILKDNNTQDILGQAHLSRVPVANGRETIFFKGKDLRVTSIRMVPKKADVSSNYKTVKAIVFVDNQIE